VEGCALDIEWKVVR